MEPTKPKMPTEAIQLYNLFIHGEISRRDFMDGVQKFAVGGLTAAAIDRSADAQLRLGAAGVEDRRPHQGQLRDRAVAARATAASKDISSGPSAPIRATRSRRNCPASSWCTKIAA